jgi:hypothetical protein
MSAPPSNITMNRNRARSLHRIPDATVSKVGGTLVASHSLTRWASEHRYITILGLTSATVIFAVWTIHGITELHTWWSSAANAASCRLHECPVSETVSDPVPQYVLWTTAASAAGTLLSGIAAVGAWISRRDKCCLKETNTSITAPGSIDIAYDSGKENQTAASRETVRKEVITKFVWSVAVDGGVYVEVRLDAAEKLALLNQDWAGQALAIVADDKSLDASNRIKAVDRLTRLSAGKAAESLWKIAVDGGVYVEVRLDAAEKLASLNQDWASQALAIIADDESLDMDARMEAADGLNALDPDRYAKAWS